MARSGPLACSLAAAAALALLLQGCGGGGGGGGGGTTTTQAPTTTTTTFAVRGQCGNQARVNGCANGFCKPDGTCSCVPNDNLVDGECTLPQEPKKMEFYMYRAQDDRTFEWENMDMASLAGSMWYLHNEVVVQSCPRHYEITRLVRLKVTVFNTATMFAVRKSLFGPFAIFDSGFCHNCMEEIYGKYGYVVGCAVPGAADNYTWAGYPPIWYSIPGSCPSQALGAKTDECKQAEPGGQCAEPNGDNDCTWNYTAAGELRIDELYGKDFNYKDYCAKLGGHNIPGEYDRDTDKGKLGITFWDDKNNKIRNAQRVESARELFAKKYPDMPELPEPWCDWGMPPSARAKADMVV